MASKRTTETTAGSADAGAGTAHPTRLRVPLRTLGDAAREAARLYRETKAGRVDPNLAGKLGFLLNTLRGLLADSELERRVAALENEREDDTNAGW